MLLGVDDVLKEWNVQSLTIFIVKKPFSQSVSL